MAEALKISPQVVIAGSRELRGERPGERAPAAPGRRRRPGAGRKAKAEQEPGLVKALEEIVDPATRGDPMRALKWTSKSLDHICGELKQQGWQVSPPTVSKILRKTLKYSMQAQKKTKEGAKQHPDRDAQFQYLSQQCKEFQQRGQPVISVEANYARSGIMRGLSFSGIAFAVTRYWPDVGFAAFHWSAIYITYLT